MKSCTYSTDCAGCVSYHDDLLQIKHVNLEFNGKPVLRDVNACIKDVQRKCHIQGQVVGFLGPSGIGKSQLFRIMAGLNKPTSGEVLVNATAEPVKAGMVGVVSQDYTLFEHRTIIGNLMLAASKKDKDKKTAHDKAIAMLARFQMLDRANLYPAQLSGGQRQRVAICQQLLCSEHFLLMDEPFSGLDILMIEKVSEFIREISCMDELNTIIVVSHDVTAAASVADHLWLMGRDRDEQGNLIPGARIKEEFNLVDLGLCWQTGIQLRSDFTDFVRHVKSKFVEL